MEVIARDVWLLAAPVAIFVYYVVVWLKIGPEPKLASVQVLYEPPPGLSPAAVRYLSKAACDGRTLAAVIAQLAARGCLEIQSQNGKYKLLKTRAGVEGNLAPEEIRVRDILFEDGTEILIKPGEGIVSNRCLLAILGQLHKQLDGEYLTRNARYLLSGLFLSLVAAVLMALTAKRADAWGIVFLTGSFFFCAYMVGAILLNMVIPSWRRARRGLGEIRRTVAALVLLAIFGGVIAVLSGVLAKQVSLSYPSAVEAMVFVNLGWAPALKRRTSRGRRAVVEIEGFRTFLQKVEEDRLRRFPAAEGQHVVNTNFLPYAVALEIRESLGDELTQALFATTTAQ